MGSQSHRPATQQSTPAPVVAPSFLPDEQDLIGNEAAQDKAFGAGSDFDLLSSRGAGQIETPLLDQGQTVGSAGFSAQDGFSLTGASTVRGEGEDRDTDRASFGYYAGDLGRGAQLCVGQDRVVGEERGDWHLRMVAADGGAELGFGGSLGVDEDGMALKVGGDVELRVSGRVERVGNEAFLVVGLGAEGSATAKGGLEGDGGSLGASIGFGAEGGVETRRRLAGADAATAQAAVAAGDAVGLLRLVGLTPAAVSALLAVGTEGTAAGTVASMVPGERVSRTEGWSLEGGLEGRVGLGGEAEGEIKVSRNLVIERVADGVDVTLALTETDAASLEASVGTGLVTAGIGGQRSGTRKVEVSAHLDPAAPGFGAQLDALTAAASAAELGALERSGLLTEAVFVKSGSGSTGMRVYGEALGARVEASAGAFSEERVSHLADGRTERRLGAGERNGGKVKFGDLELSAERFARMDAVLVDGEVRQVVFGRSSGAEIRLSAADLSGLTQLLGARGVWSEAIHGDDGVLRMPDPDFTVEWNALRGELLGMDAVARAERLHAFFTDYASLGLPAFRKVLYGTSSTGSDDVGLDVEFPAELAAERERFDAMVVRMETIEEQPPGTLEAMSLWLELERLDRVISEAELTVPQARVDMLEQVFRWRAALASRVGGALVSGPEAAVGAAEERLRGAKAHVERMMASGKPDPYALQAAYAVWLAERSDLRKAYRDAGIEPEAWRTSAPHADEVRELDLDSARLKGALGGEAESRTVAARGAL